MLLRNTSWIVTVASAVLLRSTSAPAEGAGPERTFCVSEYGAAGTGKTLDTRAIQRAIDACNAAGGGTVYLGPGDYLSGTIFLKSNVRVYLEAGAVLRGSPRAQDYAKIPRTNIRGQPAFPGGFLVFGDGVQNAAIEGRGTIDGQGPAFWHPEKVNHFVKKPMVTRPRALVCVVKGSGLRFRDVSLVNSPCYTLWLIGCDNVTIDAVTIRNPHDGPNTDGIDVDCCRSVRISNCHIEGGDDAIALKSDSGTLGEDMPCEDVTVTNCTLCSVPACGVRIGYEGDAVIRNCTFSNLAIFDTDIGLDIVSILPNRPEFTILKGTRCENIVFENITMRNVNRAIFFWLGNETGGDTQASMNNVRVSNVIAESRIGSVVIGYPKKKIENVMLSNIHLTLTATMPEKATLSGSQIWGGDWNPYAMYCSWIDGLRVDDLSIDLRRASGSWRHAVYCEKVDGAEITALRTRGLDVKNGAVPIGLTNTTATIRGCSAEAGATAFLKATSGSQASVHGCDLTAARGGLLIDKSSAASAFANRSP